MSEGEHNVAIVEADVEKFTHGEDAVAITFENDKKDRHKQLYPMTGFRTWDEEGENAKVPDALTDEEKASGEFAPEDGTAYAIRVAKKDAKGKMVALPRPERVVSPAKSEAAQAIIERLANAFGVAEGEAFELKDLKGLEGIINLKRQQVPGAGAYLRVVSFRPAVDVEAEA